MAEDSLKKHRHPWTEGDDSRLSFDWGVFNADTIADRLGRSVNSVIWRAKRLKLGPSYRGTISVAQLAEETGFHRDRVVNAARKLKIPIPNAPSPRPKSKRPTKGRRTAINEDAADQIREFLRTYPDGASIIQNPAEEWGISSRPECCNECRGTEKRHYAKGMCESCYKRARYYARPGVRGTLSEQSGGDAMTSYADLLEEAITSEESSDLVEVTQGSQDVRKALKTGGWVHVNVAGHTYELAKNRMGTGVSVRKQKGGRFGKSEQFQSIDDALEAVRLGDQASSHIIQSGSF